MSRPDPNLITRTISPEIQAQMPATAETFANCSAWDTMRRAVPWLPNWRPRLMNFNIILLIVGVLLLNEKDTPHVVAGLIVLFGPFAIGLCNRYLSILWEREKRLAMNDRETRRMVEEDRQTIKNTLVNLKQEFVVKPDMDTNAPVVNETFESDPANVAKRMG